MSEAHSPGCEQPTHKTCTDCGRALPVAAFYARAGKPPGGRCRDCTRRRFAAWRTANRAGRIFAETKMKYGLTRNQFDFLLQWQAGRCAVCAGCLSYVHHIDHDHETTAVRGVLHPRCNYLVAAVELGEIVDGAVFDLVMDYLVRTGCDGDSAWLD